MHFDSPINSDQHFAGSSPLEDESAPNETLGDDGDTKSGKNRCHLVLLTSMSLAKSKRFHISRFRYDMCSKTFTLVCFFHLVFLEMRIPSLNISATNSRPNAFDGRQLLWHGASTDTELRSLQRRCQIDISRYCAEDLPWSTFEGSHAMAARLEYGEVRRTIKNGAAEIKMR